MLVVKQVQHYTDPQRRLELAREVIKSTHNILKNLAHYQKHGKDVDGPIKT